MEWPAVQVLKLPAARNLRLQFGLETRRAVGGTFVCRKALGAGHLARASPIVFLRCRNGVPFRCGCIPPATARSETGPNLSLACGSV